MVIRCDKCFDTHFPAPKFCRKTASKTKSKTTFDRRHSKIKSNQMKTHKMENVVKLDYGLSHIPKLTGGYGESSIIVKAIESARKHKINLCAGIMNNANGDCIFESVIYNINGRECYTRKLNRSALSYRVEWISMLERLENDYPLIGAGFTDKQKKESWNKLKQPGVYQVDYFGDFVIYAAAIGSKKVILTFNTSVDASDPIYVICPENFGFETHVNVTTLPKLVRNYNFDYNMMPFRISTCNTLRVTPPDFLDFISTKPIIIG